MCLAQVYFEECNCPPFYGMNITKTECLEDRNFRDCVLSEFHFNNIYERYKQCTSGCLKKCDEKQLEIHTSRANFYYNAGNIVNMLLTINNSFEISSPLAMDLLRQIDQSENKSVQADLISQNMAQLTIYLDSTNGIKRMEIVEMISFPTLMSNIGG